MLKQGGSMTLGIYPEGLIQHAGWKGIREPQTRNVFQGQLF